jgi:hypothetical protein
MKFISLILLLSFGFKLSAQEADFEAFINKFPKADLPYTCAYKPNLKFNKSLKISKLEAETWLAYFKSPFGHEVNLYEVLIEPFGPTKGRGGRTLVTKMEAEKVALLKKTDDYVMILTRVKFLEKVADYSEGERYLLHTFQPDGTPISVLWVAQRIQFDLHYNQISSKIDANGLITSTVEVFAPSENTKKEEVFQIQENGEIVVIKE